MSEFSKSYNIAENEESIVKYYKGALGDYDPKKWPTYQTLGTRGDGNFILNISNIYTNLDSQQDMINKNASAATASAATASGQIASGQIASAAIPSAAYASGQQASAAIASAAYVSGQQA